MIFKEDKRIEKVLSRGYNPNTNETALVTLNNHQGLYIQSYLGGKRQYNPITEQEADELKARHKKELEGKDAINWLRSYIKLEKSHGVYIRPSIISVAKKLLQNNSRTWEDFQEKTCYDCNGPSWSHSSWEEWRGSGEWYIDRPLAKEMEDKLNTYLSISKQLDW